MDDYQTIRNLELELVQAQTRSNPARLNELLADEFEEIGSSGTVYDKAEVLKQLPNQTTPKYELSGFSFTRLSDKRIRVNYLALCDGIHTVRRSVWVHRCGSWAMIHHQSTLKIDHQKI